MREVEEAGAGGGRGPGARPRHVAERRRLVRGQRASLCRAPADGTVEAEDRARAAATSPEWSRRSGAGVDGLAPGDEVYGCQGGAFAEYVVAGKAVERKPANLSFEEAAAVPVAALTALQGLRDHGGVEAGAAGPRQRRLRAASAPTRCRSPRHSAHRCTPSAAPETSTRHASSGADRVFDYTSEDFTRSGARYDVVFDNAGNRSWLSMCRVLAPNGIVVLVGGPRKRMLGPLGHVIRIMLASKLSSATNAVFFMAKPNRDDLATLRDLIEAGQVRPVIEQPSSSRRSPRRCAR